MRNLRSGLVVLLAGFLWGGCATVPVPEASPQHGRSVFTATETSATVVFDPRVLSPSREPTSVGLVGTFNAWNEHQLWALQKQDDGTWRGSFPRKLIGVPGNSGLPEFQFILDGGDRIPGSRAPVGQRFANNFVILWPGVTEAVVAERDAQNQIVRSGYASEAELTNFRELDGGRLAPGQLYRSYHPFLASRELPLEAARLAGVQRLMEEQRIAAVINLSDSASVLENPRTPGLYKELAGRGRVLFAPTHYSVVYFGSDGAEFAAELKQVLSFVAANPGPYLIHCRLGTDRTGVVSAVLEALAGVPWRMILEDFQKSNAMGIKEYRSPELLTYSFEKLLGQNPATLPDLAAALRTRLGEKGIDPDTLDQVLAHLTRQSSH